MKKIFGLVGLMLIALGTCYYVVQYVSMQSHARQVVANAHYQCAEGKTIDVVFYSGASKPAASPDMPPVPGGSVRVVLSDGRTYDIAQTISADGGRYANPDESFVFWSKGNGALVLENNQEKSYLGCITVAADTGGLPEVFTDAGLFSIRYPARYAVDSSYAYTGSGPGKNISGVKFTIDSAVATGTNLAADSYVSVEHIPQATDCNALLFLSGRDAKVVVFADTDREYSVASSTDAGAGNRYEEIVYALPGTNPCIAVRYFIHWGAFENYTPGAVREFDHDALVKTFDAVRRTLTVTQ